MSTALVFCDCVDGPAASTSSAPTSDLAPTPAVPTSARRGYAHWHALSTLFFCEECDAVRCPRWSVEGCSSDLTRAA